jgi:hypothetical protein
VQEITSAIAITATHKSKISCSDCSGMSSPKFQRTAVQNGSSGNIEIVTEGLQRESNLTNETVGRTLGTITPTTPIWTGKRFSRVQSVSK